MPLQDVWRALTLTQPWATLMAIGAKQYETRVWPTKYRGWLAIHASAKFPKECRVLCAREPFRARLAQAGYLGSMSLPLGRVVGVVCVLDCVRTEQVAYKLGAAEHAFGDYSKGRYAFRTAGARRVRTLPAVKGALSLWFLPQAITPAELER